MKKRGFSLIELIIVIAIMAIIAAIAIPNLSSVRDNTKNKADEQSCEAIKRATMTLISEEMIAKPATGVIKMVTFDQGGDDKNFTFSNMADAKEHTNLEDALKNVKHPVGKTKSIINKDGELDSAASEAAATKFAVTMDSNEVVSVVTIQ